MNNIKILIITCLSFNYCLSQTQWQLTFGTTATSDIAHSIIQTTDSGYVVAGGEYFYGGGSHTYIAKFNTICTLQWTRILGGGTSIDYANSIIQTADGGYAIAGDISGGDYSMYILKLDTSGTLQWARTIGGTNNDYANSIIQTTDGGYAVAGSTDSFGSGNYDMYIVKLGISGSLLWSKTVGGTGDDEAHSIIQTTDNGYAVGGYTSSFGATYYNVYIIKFDTSGTIQWTRTVGETNYDDYAYSILQSTDGGYAIAGHTRPVVGNGDFYILKLNSNSTLQWNRSVGGTGDDIAYSIIHTLDGGYAVTGQTGSFGTGLGAMYIVKFDASGNTCGNFTSQSSSTGTGGTLGNPNSVTTTPNPIITTLNPTIGSNGNVTTLCFVGIQPISNKIPISYELYQNYPNPFNPTTKIKFSIPSNVKSETSNVKLVVYNVLGKEAATLVNEKLSPGTYEVEWNGSNYPSGVYFYKLTISDPETSSGLIFNETKKMMLMK